jgi:hypothetical protein
LPTTFALIYETIRRHVPANSNPRTTFRTALRLVEPTRNGTSLPTPHSAIKWFHCEDVCAVGLGPIQWPSQKHRRAITTDQLDAPELPLRLLTCHSQSTHRCSTGAVSRVSCPSFCRNETKSAATSGSTKPTSQGDVRRRDTAGPFPQLALYRQLPYP